MCVMCPLPPPQTTKVRSKRRKSFAKLLYLNIAHHTNLVFVTMTVRMITLFLKQCFGEKHYAVLLRMKNKNTFFLLGTFPDPYPF